MVNEAELAEVAVLLARQRRAILAATAEAIAESESRLRDELAAEVAQITRRIDAVHSAALRALTDRIERSRTR